MAMILFRLSVYVDGKRKVTRAHDPDPDIKNSIMTIGKTVKRKKETTNVPLKTLTASLSIKDMIYEGRTYKTRDIHQVRC